MIHLDTNILIALPQLVHENHPLIERVARGESAAVRVPVWYEYLIGPSSDTERLLAEHFIRSDIVPPSVKDAQRAATLFNAGGRRRGLKSDAPIAAVAIGCDAELLTFNTADFEPFVAHGLRLFKG